MIKVIFKNVTLFNQKHGSYGYAEDIFEDPKVANEWIAKMQANPDFANVEPQIIDLSSDINYMNNYIQTKRREEYPDINEVIEALLEEAEDRPEKLMLILMKRQIVKEKWPLIVVEEVQPTEEEK